MNSDERRSAERHYRFARACDTISFTRDISVDTTVLNDGKPRIGAHGVPVIFVHPKDMGGVLVELMETPKGAHR